MMTVTSAAAKGSSSNPPLATLVRRVVDDVMSTILGHLELAGIEARDAGSALAQIAVAAGVAVLLLASTWFLLLAAGVIGLIALGIHPGLVLLLAAVVTLVAGVACVALIRPKLASLQFPATLRQLRLAIVAHTPS